MKYLRKFNEMSENKPKMDLLYCKDCGEYIGGISPNNLCLGCSNKDEDKQDSLKSRLIDHYQEQESEYDPEETLNVLEILNDYDDNLDGLGSTDKTLLLRLINDDELYDEVDAIQRWDMRSNDNAFD